MSSTIKLTTGTLMPLIGFGTFRLTGYENVLKSLDAALACGYRLIDTAQIYANEADIGQALSVLLPKYSLDRKDLFLTSKLSTANMSAEKARPSIEQSLRDLKTDYIDLFLIHYPKPSWSDKPEPNAPSVRRECWLELEKLHTEGKLRAIGVSNYEIRHLEELKNYATIQPAVNQCEFHPHYARRDLVDYHRERNIQFQAFTSLGRNHPDLLSEPLLVQLSEKYHVPITQILLAWPLAQNIAVIPKSSNPDRIKENFESINVQLSKEDIEKIWSLHKNVNYTACKPWTVP